MDDENPAAEFEAPMSENELIAKLDALGWRLVEARPETKKRKGSYTAIKSHLHETERTQNGNS